MHSILSTIPFYKSHFPHTQLFSTHLVVKVICQKVCLCQKYNNYIEFNSHRSWASFIVQESISVNHNYLNSTLSPFYLLLHPNSLTNSRNQQKVKVRACQHTSMSIILYFRKSIIYYLHSIPYSYKIQLQSKSQVHVIWLRKRGQGCTQIYPHPFICLAIHNPLSNWGK